MKHTHFLTAAKNVDGCVLDEHGFPLDGDKYACNAIDRAVFGPYITDHSKEAEWFADTFQPQPGTDEERYLHQYAFFSFAPGSNAETQAVRVLALCFAYAMKGVL